jgi:diadenosine tetraphosphate (Ap4A) HIT family hydrolase
MYHFRSTRRTYEKLNSQDKKQTVHCSFPSCDGASSQSITEENETMYVIDNRITYDIFEGRRVLDHKMVIPKRHVESLADFTQQEKIDHMEVIGNYEKQGYNIYARGAGSVTRSVKHQHTHLIKTSHKLPKGTLYIRKPYFLMQM